MCRWTSEMDLPEYIFPSQRCTFLISILRGAGRAGVHGVDTNAYKVHPSVLCGDRQP